VPGAGVEIKDNAKRTVQSTKTDQWGVYRFFFVAPGRYMLNVSHPGFRGDALERVSRENRQERMSAPKEFRCEICGLLTSMPVGSHWFVNPAF
jgi:hypothetical protein